MNISSLSLMRETTALTDRITVGWTHTNLSQKLHKQPDSRWITWSLDMTLYHKHPPAHPPPIFILSWYCQWPQQQAVAQYGGKVQTKWEITPHYRSNGSLPDYGTIITQNTQVGVGPCVNGRNTSQYLTFVLQVGRHMTDEWTDTISRTII